MKGTFKGHAIAGVKGVKVACNERKTSRDDVKGVKGVKGAFGIHTTGRVKPVKDVKGVKGAFGNKMCASLPSPSCLNDPGTLLLKMLHQD